MEIISSVNNDNVKRVASLGEKKFRRYYGTFLVEGPKLVQEIVYGAMELQALYVESSCAVKYSDLIAKCEPNVYLLSKPAFEKISDTVSSQGILAEVKMRTSVDFALDQPIVVLDRVSDPGNLGTIIRTAAATGFETIVLIDCCDPYNPKTVRASSGGIFYTDFYQLSFEEFADKWKNLPVYLADMDGENIFKMKEIDKVYALVIGNEGSGVSDQFEKLHKRTISLPMKSQMESLNAGVSASVLMYELKKNEF